MHHRPMAAALFLVACGTGGDKPPVFTFDAATGADPDASRLVPDASSDAPGPTTWCTGRPEVFCDDFDRPAFSAQNWLTRDLKGDSPGLPAGGLDTVSYTSAPNAFVARTPALASGAFALLQIQASRPQSKSHVDAELAFSVHVGAMDAASRLEIARIEGVNPIDFSTYAVALSLSASGASLAFEQGRGGSGGGPIVAAPPAVGAWTRITIQLGLDVVVNGAALPVTVQIGTAPPETFSIARGMGVSPRFALGLKVSGPSGPSEVTYDDVTFDAR